MVRGTSKHRELSSLISNKAIASSDAFISGSALILLHGCWLLAAAVCFGSIDVNSETARCLLLHESILAYKGGQVVECAPIIAWTLVMAKEHAFCAWSSITRSFEYCWNFQKQWALLRLTRQSHSLRSRALRELKLCWCHSASVCWAARQTWTQPWNRTVQCPVRRARRYCCTGGRASASILDMRNKAYARIYMHIMRYLQKKHSDYLLRLDRYWR